jgi:hypothetical protein
MVVAQPVDVHDLVSGVGAAYDGHASRADTHTLGYEAAERGVCAIVDRWRAHAHAQHGVALADDLIDMRAGRHTHGDLAPGNAAHRLRLDSRVAPARARSLPRRARAGLFCQFGPARYR